LFQTIQMFLILCLTKRSSGFRLFMVRAYLGKKSIFFLNKIFVNEQVTQMLILIL
jgi:hypothetical protein